jgi:trimeric autotransporter adhesin
VEVAVTQNNFSVRILVLAALLSASSLALAGGCGAEREEIDLQERALSAQEPAVAAISVTPGTVTAGQNATGTVTLNAVAPAGGTPVALFSNNLAAVTVPASVTVPAGSTSASFTLTSHPVASADWAAISATAGQVTQTAVLNVTPGGLTLATLTLAPTVLAGGATGTGTVTLSGTAPQGGASVALSSGDPLLATVPPSVTVLAGATSATFAVTGQIGASAAGLAISASYGGVTRSAWLVVTEPPPSGRQLNALTLSPEIVVGGQPVQGTVTLASAQGAATTVALRSYNPTVATVPASVTVPSGVASASFTVTTRATSSSDFAVIEAEAGGITRSTTVTTTAPPTGPLIVSLVFFPPSVGGGGPVTGRATFNGPATQAAIVELTSSNPSLVQVPSSVVVLKNATRADFPVTTSAVTSNVAVSINGTACCGGQGSAQGTLTVTTAAPPAADVVRVERAEFKPGGRGGTLTVRATSSSATAILTVFRDQSSVPTFTLNNNGGGRYEGSFSFSGSKPNTVTVKSNLGGAATANVK